MEKPSNTEAANREDTVTYWRIGRAKCPHCQEVRAYVAHVDVEQLRCNCGEICIPHQEEAE